MNKRKLSFKWFVSLTNLSIRRPSEKANIKAGPEHDGSLDGAKSAARAQSVDDMDDCLRSPSYARSSEMHTHVGTVPRTQKQKKSLKGLREGKKKKEEGVSEGQSQWKAGDHVRDSPLLSALSSLSLTSMDRPLPATPTPSRASPLTFEPNGCVNDPSVDPIKNQGSQQRSRDNFETSRDVRGPLNVATNGTKTAMHQDVYVPMDPIAEAARSHVGDQTETQFGVTSTTQETKKTVNGSQEVKCR
ncbi:hypothetical protein CesoFtcFv8_003268 [Champsocephalus esox]|uniref:Uncharacterized protein n=1 Tax=Champsocephalus esox TaxID=159716 RepID=A0AAN8CY00_9TELE|nr:hypothetical protein CesoFtcFv8_003268 [Champsocephalus esox]